jgi:hypothetical protein
MTLPIALKRASRSKAIALMVLVAFAGILWLGTRAYAQVVTYLHWQQPYGLRGQVIPATVRLTDGASPLPGWKVGFWHRSDNYGSRFLGYATTDGQGYARMNYQIPTDPNSDNVYLIAKFDPYFTIPSDWITVLSGSQSNIRIQIGRQYP